MRYSAIYLAAMCLPVACGVQQVRGGDPAKSEPGEQVEERCGDAIVQTGEECDRGARNSDSGPCTTACLFNVCGDKKLNAKSEECDDGNQDNTDACVRLADPENPGAWLCRVASCGDGVVQAGVEPCDDGNSDEEDECNSKCASPRCGDGVLQESVEDCDLGPKNSDSGACIARNCLKARCGDGFTYAGVEECDDQNDDDTDRCRKIEDPSHPKADIHGFVCLKSVCGDGIIQPVLGESCDDGNTSDTGSDGKPDGCSAACQVLKNFCCIDETGCVPDLTVNEDDPCLHCKSETSEVAWTAIPAGESCEDHNPCTLNTTCNAQGQCRGTDLGCDDGNICTEDSCNSSVASGDPCEYTPEPDGKQCADRLFCNGTETCSGGSCQGENPCTSAAEPGCIEYTTPGNGNGECVACSNSAHCSAAGEPVCNEATNTCVGCLGDGDCNAAGQSLCRRSICIACLVDGHCPAATPYCKTNAQDPSQNRCRKCGGINQAEADAVCDDGLYCTGKETCDNGTCQSGAPPSCGGSQPYCNESLNSCAQCGENSHCTAATSRCSGVSNCTYNGPCDPGRGDVTCYYNQCNGGLCANNVAYQTTRSCRTITTRTSCSRDPECLGFACCCAGNNNCDTTRDCQGGIPP